METENPPKEPSTLIDKSLECIDELLKNLNDYGKAVDRYIEYLDKTIKILK